MVLALNEKPYFEIKAITPRNMLKIFQNETDISF